GIYAGIRSLSRHGTLHQLGTARNLHLEKGQEMKTLIQGGYVVGFNGQEHEIIRDGAVVFENDRILFVGKQYFEPVEKKIEAKGRLVSPGLIDTHFHSGINATDYLLTEPDKPDFFASNYLAHGA